MFHFPQLNKQNNHRYILRKIQSIRYTSKSLTVQKLKEGMRQFSPLSSKHLLDFIFLVKFSSMISFNGTRDMLIELNVGHTYISAIGFLE